MTTSKNEQFSTINWTVSIIEIEQFKLKHKLHLPVTQFALLFELKTEFKVHQN